MKITVTTKQPNRFIRETSKLLSKEQADELLNGQFTGDAVSWERLSIAQFCALEDTAVRMGLQYDGTQESEREEHV